MTASEPERDSVFLRVLMRTIRGVGVLVGGIAVVVALALAAVQFDALGTQVARAVADRIVPPGLEFSVGRVSGSWIGSLTMTDMALTATDGSEVVRVDTLEVSYDLLPLLSRRIRLNDVEVVGARTSLVRRGDGAIGLSGASPGRSASPQSASDPWALSLGSLRIDGAMGQLSTPAAPEGSAEQSANAPSSDSLQAAAPGTATVSEMWAATRVTWSGLQVALHDLSLSDGLSLILDSATARVDVPDLPTESAVAPLDIRAAGRLAQRRISLDTLTITAPDGRVDGAGDIVLPRSGSRVDAPTEEAETLDFRLVATNLPLAPLHAFLGNSAAPEARLSAEVDVTGTTQLPRASVEVATNGGGRVSGTLAFDPGGAGTARYRADLDVTSLDPMTLIGDTAIAGDVSGTLAVDLEGSTRTSLDGTARLRLDPLRIGTLPVRSIGLESTWAAGEATIEFRAAGDGLRADLSGQARPMDDVPSFDLGGPISVKLPLSSEPPDSVEPPRDSATPTRLAGSVSIRGSGISPDSASASLEMTLSTVTIGPADFGSARLVAQLDSGRIVARLDAEDATDGTLTADGTVVLGTPTTFRLSDVVARDLDVAGLIGDTVPSRLNAQVTGSGTVGDPMETRLTADVTLRDARYGSLRVDTTALNATLDGGRLRGTGRVRSTAGRFDFEIDGRPLGEVPTVDDMRVDFAELDLGALAGDSAGMISTSVTGSLTGGFRGASPDDLVVDLEFRADSSRVGRQPITRAGGSVALDGGRVDLRAQVTLPDSGRIDVAATARPFDDRPTARLRDLTFRALDPTAFVGGPVGSPADDPPVSASLSGAASGQLEGSDPGTMLAAVSIDLDASRVGREPVREGRVEMRISEGRVQSEARFDFASGTLTADGSMDVGAEVPEYALTARITAGRLDRLLGADSTAARSLVDATLALEGRGTTPATMEAEVKAFADSAAFGDVRVDTLRLIGRIAKGTATVDTLTLRSNALSASGSGSVAIVETATGASDFRLSGRVQSVAPLQDFVGITPIGIGAGDFDVRITGPPDQATVTASANASALLLGTTELVGLESSLEATMTPSLELGPTTGRIALDRLTAGSVEVRLTEVTGSWSGEELALEGDATLDDRREVSVELRADPRAETSRLELDRLDVRVDDDRWELSGSPRISWVDGIQVDNLALRSGDQALTMDGRLDLEGSSDLRGSIDQLRLGGIADLVGFDRLDGTASAELDVQGPATSPRIRLDLEADLSDDRGRESSIEGTLSYDTLRLDVDASVEAEGGGRIVIAGGLPMDLDLTRTAAGDTTRVTAAAAGRSDLEIRADSFQVAWIEPFLDPAVARGLRGHLEADARVGGTQDAPVLTGEATLREAGMTAPGLGVSYEDVGLRLSLRDDVARIDSAFARAGDGTMNLSGTISLPELSLGEFDLEGRFDRFRAMNNDAYRVRMSGTAVLGGTTAAPLLEGDLDLVETDVYLDDAVSSGASVRPVKLTDEQVREVEQYLGVSVSASERDPGRLFELMTIDLSVNASRDTWVRQRTNPEMEIQLTGDVQVTKEPADSIRFDGVVEAVPTRSYVEQFGRRFSIEQGQIDLVGTVPETRIDVRATYRVPSRGNPDSPEVTITLDIDGTMRDLSLTLGSEPEMENADIVSYLATGRPASTGLAVGGEGEGGLGSIGTDYALGQVTGLVEGLAAEGIGLDVVEIEADGLRGATLVAGRFVNPKVYVGFRQPIGQEARDDTDSGDVNRTEVELEYEALRWLLLNMEASNSAISFFFRFRHAY